MIKLFIVDDHKSYTEGLKSLFNSNKRIKVVGDADSGERALLLLKNIKPDIVTVDIDMPKMNGLELIKNIKGTYPSLKIIVLTAFNDKILLSKLINEGVNGFCVKDANVDDIIETIISVANGNEKFNCTATSDYKSDVGKLNETNLTTREIEIIKYLSLGYNSENIAEAVFLSKYTIDNYKKNIFIKTKVKTAAELVAFAIRNSIIE